MHERLYQAINAIVPLTSAEWARLSPLFSTRLIRKGQFYAEAGQVCQTVFFINKGAFRSYALVDGHEVNWCFHFDGSWASDYDSFLSGRPSLFSIQATEDAEIVVLTKRSMHGLYAMHACYERIGRLIAESLFLVASRRGIDFLFKTPEERYLNLLDTYPAIFRRMPLYHIASYLGITGPSLSRIRRRLSQQTGVAQADFTLS
jgi:CRP-like cAMP-binding protein